MTNADVAQLFDEIADLMEIRGDDGFRVNAYRRVARTIGDLTASLKDLAARGELGGLPGVGKGTADKIAELLETGKIALRDELLAVVPGGLLELRRIQGLGPKKIALLWKERGIDSIERLSDAISKGELEKLKGFGAKSVESLRQGLAFLATVAGRTRLGVAADIAEHFRELLGRMNGVERVEYAGSLRRGAETVGDIDLLCVARDGAGIIREFTEHANAQQVFGAGETKGSILYLYGPNRTIQVDLRVVPAVSFGAAYLYFTGSKEHNVRLREMAIQRGWSLNEYGLTEGKKVIASETEEDIYRALDLPWIPPELREDRGEFAVGAVPKDLLKLEDIRGDLHMHTTASDGRNTIEEMIRGAKARGYKYICITDHSRSSFVANGLTEERLRAHVQAIRDIAVKAKGITVWAGAEVDILSDGTLDYPDDVLTELDFVIASLHAGMSADESANTRRTLAAIENPYVNLIAHPTGRLINRREAMPLDMEVICEAAARTGTALEINASSHRLDMKDQHARFARDSGVKICIDCDAHAIDHFDQMRFGVMTARRAGLRKEDVLNTHSAKDVREFVTQKRRKLLRKD
ncbi:MAG: DNA polymerase/3'-5' exonuclease PolX [Phycisphaerae bacterium]